MTATTFTAAASRPDAARSAHSPARERALAAERDARAREVERLAAEQEAAAERASGAAEARAKNLEQRLLALRDAERASDTRLAEALERLERRLGADNNDE